MLGTIPIEMDVFELIRYQLDDSAQQLRQVLKDFPEEALETSIASSMSARQSVVHLTDVYQATVAGVEGRKHEWGTFTGDGIPFDRLLAGMWAAREEAISKAIDGTTEHLKTLNNYVVGHDYYHVGQLCTARLNLQPEWDPYSIYH